MIEDPHTHFERDDVVAEYSSFEFLLPPEQVIFARFRPWIEGARVLDVGVGAGRTTTHLAPVASTYVGTDISRAMIEACRQRFPSLDGDSFLVLDARDMAPLEDASFDFVLFSFNGLDLVGDHRSRLAALSEMRRVCRPGGLVCFSAENLSYIEKRLSYWAVLLDALRRTSGSMPRKRLNQVRRILAHAAMWRRLNPRPSALAEAGHAMITEERPRQEFSSRFFETPQERIQVRRYFVRPSVQAQQLVEAGFEDVRVFDSDGTDVTERAHGGLTHAWWLYYLATRSANGGSERMDDTIRPPKSPGDPA